jgi:hypothetical protein
MADAQKSSEFGQAARQEHEDHGRIQNQRRFESEKARAHPRFVQKPDEKETAAASSTRPITMSLLIARSTATGAQPAFVGIYANFIREVEQQADKKTATKWSSRRCSGRCPLWVECVAKLF